ncbi:MAG TPA: S-methyl-5-thioribose-1-phosphate isomerase [Gammaproteobacteria bacterium]|nr:S-methyl-5-thioribose-1-phosphate isomerase [Gammaproteobacteria bacterium]
MKINGQPYRSIWMEPDSRQISIIDQTRLPHAFEIRQLTSVQDAAQAISDMWVRGAPLIGATTACGMALAMSSDSSDENLKESSALLLASRPTAVNLRWAIDVMQALLAPIPPSQREAAAWQKAAEVCDEDVDLNSHIGDHGARVIEALWQKKNQQGRINILTHCNAGWLATVDWGTALAPVYKAHNAGIPVHIWVDETRPRNQGASLTAWELNAHGVPHHIIVDNAGGHLMQHGKVDLCIVGTDRTTASGDVCNKIGTYLKALAAKDNDIPFYVALPSPTIDWNIDNGLRDIPIEERDEEEVTHIQGKAPDGSILSIQLPPDGCPASNPAFDVTPARLITGLITERGVSPASREGLTALFPEVQGKDHA